MFAPSPVRAAANAPAVAYRQMGVQTGVTSASSHQLVLMLFDGFDEALVQARGALQSGAVERKCRCIGRALRIVDEGLKANLDLAGGGALAADLNDLYGYVAVRLLHAQLHNDEAALSECRHLVRPLRDAWAQIGSPAHHAA
ncbi:MAG: flagellar export chaperone FliS [Rubrivivax sp.]